MHTPFKLALSLFSHHETIREKVFPLKIIILLAVFHRFSQPVGVFMVRGL